MKPFNETIEIPVEVETSTDPDDSHTSTYVDATVIDVRGTNRSARVLFEGEASDEQVAAGLVCVASAAALAHSSGAYWALQRLLADPGRTP